MNRSFVIFVSICMAVVFAIVLTVPRSGECIPAFSRKYSTSCTTCHYAFPKLNAFGKAFKNNGYRYPGGQDEDMTKEEPVSLGSESYKRVWPDAVWPSNMAGGAPISIHGIQRAHYDKEAEDEKSLYFETPHEFALLFGGTIGPKFSYFGEVELEHASEMGYTFHLTYNYSPCFNIRVGDVGLHASPEHHRLTAEHYNVDNLKNQSGTWRMRSGAGSGIEFWGAGNGAGGKGGYTYALGIGNGQDNDENYDVNTDKDFFARVTYKIGGLGEIGGTEGQASKTSAFYEDDSLRLGAFYYTGKATVFEEEVGNDDDYTVVGGDVDWWFKRLIVTALALQMKSDYMDVERTSMAYFLGAKYVIFPWLIVQGRYEYTDKDTDDDSVDAEESFIPSILAVIRANVKCSVEYLIPLDTPRKDAEAEKLTFQLDFAI